MKVRNVVIVDGCRSAFSRGGVGKFEATRMDEIGVQVVKALLARNPKVKPTMIDEFGMGNGARAMDLSGLNNISRMVGLPYEVSNFFTDRHCASSMECLLRIAMAIILGQYDCGIAFGIERMTREIGGGRVAAPVTRVSGYNPKVLVKNEIQRNLAHDHFEYFSTPIPDWVLDSPGSASMVQTAQNVVEMYNMTREEMDAFTVRSHKKLGAAYDKGIYKDEIIPVEIEEPVFDEKRQWVESATGPKVIFDRDECVRPNTNMETLAKLPPVKGIVSYSNQELKITAGNSCPTNSGVSTVLLMSEEMATKLGLEPLARIVGWGNGGVKQQIMGMGPVVSTKKALRHAGLEPDQIDRVEFNEAFACQVIASLKELGIPEEKTNVNGGSLGIGHPLGATGCRIVLTVAHELRRSGKKYGLATQCIGAGQGATTILQSMG
ncbi:MAG: thiolase family protein [Deltaproteobacteria bacterium]|nr:thiolase family protein [Deltaproteobacteria bacterium]